MKISSISDLHIKEAHDEGYKVLISFLESADVQSSSKVILLGDIFDLMVANKQEYIKKFKELFNLIDKLLEQKKKVFFFEGNHDFNIEKILTNYFSNENFIYSTKPLVFTDADKKIYYSHGDELDKEDIAYIRWKKVCSSLCFRFILDHFFSYSFISWLGKWMSKKSRKKGMKKFNYEKVRVKVEGIAKKFIEKENVDYLVCGHNHVESLFENYANNGYGMKTKKYIVYERKTLSLKALPSMN